MKALRAAGSQKRKDLNGELGNLLGALLNLCEEAVLAIWPLGGKRDVIREPR